MNSPNLGRDKLYVRELWSWKVTCFEKIVFWQRLLPWCDFFLNSGRLPLIKKNIFKINLMRSISKEILNCERMIALDTQYLKILYDRFIYRSYCMWVYSVLGKEGGDYSRFYMKRRGFMSLVEGWIGFLTAAGRCCRYASLYGELGLRGEIDIGFLFFSLWWTISSKPFRTHGRTVSKWTPASI